MEMFQPGQRTGFSGFLSVAKADLYSLQIEAYPGCSLAIDGVPIHNKRRDNRMVWEERIGLEAGFHMIPWLYSDDQIPQADTILNLRLRGSNGVGHLLGERDFGIEVPV